MNKYFINAIAGITFALLVGCQVVSGDRTINEYSTDAALTTNVKTALLDNSHVTSLPIHVETDKGTVVLSGFVKTKQQKMEAEKAARHVRGVKVVKNNLIVRR